MASSVQLGGSNLSLTSQAQDVAQSKPTGKSYQFDVIVFPNAPCKLKFEVVEKRIARGADKGESSKDSRKWKRESRELQKPTIVHLTIPGSSYSFGIVVHTKNAESYSMSGFRNSKGFASKVVRVSEDEIAQVFQVGVIYSGDVAKATGELSQDAGEETIVIADDAPPTQDLDDHKAGS